MPTFTLPHDFLSGPGPKVQKVDVDFRYTELPENEGRYATILDNVLTKDECDSLVRAAEAQSNGWEQAMINLGGNRQAMMTDIRDCGRIMWDDTDVVDKIWSRIKDLVPEIAYLKDRGKVTGNWSVMRGETWEMTRLNERMRFLKYGAGQYFKRKYYCCIYPPSIAYALTTPAHDDSPYVTPNGRETSFFTLHLYLNESTPTNKLKGGATTFHSYDMQRSVDVIPKVGRVLIFQHRDLLHSGADVTDGIKLTMRTDCMYRKRKK